MTSPLAGYPELAPPPKHPEFESKRKLWIRCLNHIDPATAQLDRNCVFAQVSDMIWTAGAYRVVLEARRIAEEDSKGQLKLDGLTHTLLDQCFYQSQLLGIRRLMDSAPLTDKRGVLSLKPLVLDMKTHRALFTRENLFAAFELPMNLEALAIAKRDEFRQKSESGLDHFHLPIGGMYELARGLHRDIDGLTGVPADARSPSDCVPESVFASLEAKFAHLAVICSHVDKFLAHAATPESRSHIQADQAKITYFDLWDAHETICRALQFIDCYLLRRTSHAFLPMTTEDIFKYADRPLVRNDQIGVLRDAWNAYDRETAAWAHNCLEWLIGATATAMPQEGSTA